MIDARDLARIVREEIRIIAPRFHTSAPVRNDAELFEYEVAKVPLADEAPLASVIDELFWASMLAEEGRPCRPLLVYTPELAAATHRFEPPLPLTRDVLRKLGPAQEGRGLVWDLRDGRPSIVGLHPRPGATRGVTVAATGPGALEVTWSHLVVLAYRGGVRQRLSSLGYRDLIYAVSSVARDLSAPNLMALLPVIQGIARDGHGGAVWVLPPNSPTSGLINIARPIAVDPRSLFEKFASSSDEKARFAWLDSVAALAAVDGAVVLDFDLRLLGFGAFLGATGPVSVQRWETASTARLTDSAEGWGGRHRSAAAFCNEFAPACAFVVSEDGGISTFCASAKGLVQHRPILALGHVP